MHACRMQALVLRYSPREEVLSASFFWEAAFCSLGQVILPVAAGCVDGPKHVDGGDGDGWGQGISPLPYAYSVLVGVFYLG